MASPKQMVVEAAEMKGKTLKVRIIKDVKHPLEHGARLD
jgi:hypothetical protein